MPELPEVETIRLGLEKYLVGHKIVNVEVRLPKILQGDIEKVKGARVKGARRFGKALVIDLDNGYSIAAHVKMTGQFIYDGPNRPQGIGISRKLVGTLPSKFTHVIFNLDKGGKLYYNDIRQFGWIKVVSTSNVERMSFVNELGPEPPVAIDMEGRSLLTLEKFREVLSNKKTKIKALLMDQKRIGGVGNIYANDALFLAGINPNRVAKDLSEAEVERLYEAVLEVLKRGLKYKGASETNFVSTLGEEGEYQKHFLIYGHEKSPCPKCGGKVSKVWLGGRGTYFCPQCQK